MIHPLRRSPLILAVACCAVVTACQSPTDPEDTVDVDDILEVSASPDPTSAEASTDGRTYRVVRGNNQPDEILLFDWKTSFSVMARFTDQADDDEYLTFPIDLTSATIKVQQASGGIVTSPTGGEIEHYDYVTQASSNRFSSPNASVSLGFDVWYDLPSLRKEALITVTLSFRDADGVTLSKAIDVRVSP